MSEMEELLVELDEELTWRPDGYLVTLQYLRDLIARIVEDQQRKAQLEHYDD